MERSRRLKCPICGQAYSVSFSSAAQQSFEDSLDSSRAGQHDEGKFASDIGKPANKQINESATRVRVSCPDCDVALISAPKPDLFSGKPKLQIGPGQLDLGLDFSEDLDNAPFEAETDVQQVFSGFRTSSVPEPHGLEAHTSLVEKRSLPIENSPLPTGPTAAWPEPCAPRGGACPAIPEQWESCETTEPARSQPNLKLLASKLTRPVQLEIKTVEEPQRKPPRKERKAHDLRGSPLRVLLIPVAICLTLWAWTLVDQNSSKRISAWFSAVSPASTLPPPEVGLEVLGVEPAVVWLEDGTRILEVSGKLFNATLVPQYEVTLEAKLYDAKNRELREVIVPAHNGITDAVTIESLSVESLENLQRRSGVGQFRLNPSESVPFRLVLSGWEEEAAYLSVRVYSVGNRS